MPIAYNATFNRSFAAVRGMLRSKLEIIVKGNAMESTKSEIDLMLSASNTFLFRAM
jgi:hypothetical protein